MANNESNIDGFDFTSIIESANYIDYTDSYEDKQSQYLELVKKAVDFYFDKGKIALEKELSEWENKHYKPTSKKVIVGAYDDESSEAVNVSKINEKRRNNNINRVKSYLKELQEARLFFYNFDFTQKIPSYFEGIYREAVPKIKADIERMKKENTKMVLGKKRQITLPNGEKHNAQFAIVELGDIIASHNEETFADSEGYPRNSQGNNLNDRNYATDKAAQQLVEEYARNLNPGLLIALTSTPEGTPIITPEGIVVSGNNRTMSLKLASKKYPEKWKLYQESLLMDLDVYGLDDFAESKNDALPPERTMKRPVLVRIDYDFGEMTTNNMAKYNASSMKAKSPVDKAAELATTLREQILCETNIPKIIGEFDTLSDFYADRAAIKRMVAAMQQCSVLNEQDMPAYLDAGYFTEDGKTLLETILAALILETDTLRIANRDGVKSLRQAVVNALPILIANKNLDKSATIIPEVNAAIRYQGEIVASGLSWENFVNQGNIFTSERASCNTVYINRLMNEGQRIFRDAVRRYNESQAQAGLSALFASDVVTTQEAFEGYIIAKLPESTVKRVKLYCEAKDQAPAPKIAPAPKSAPAPAPDPVKSSKEELQSRLKLLPKMIEKAEGEAKAILQGRMKLVKKMLEKA